MPHPYFFKNYRVASLHLHSHLNLNPHSYFLARQIPQWQAPGDGIFKINCDAAVSDKCICIAVVVRDWKDRVIVTGTRVDDNTTVCAIEAKWFRWAILLSQDLNLRKVVIEGDSKVSIDAINKVLKGEKPIFVPWEALHFIENSYDMAKEQD